MTKDEREKQKALALAKLVKFKLNGFPLWITGRELRMQQSTARAFDCDPIFNPYADTDRNGLAQFAAILLKFPEAMACQFSTVCLSDGSMLTRNTPVKPTQANILDEILKLNSKWQEEWNE